jgi:WD40 repeat protein
VTLRPVPGVMTRPAIGACCAAVLLGFSSAVGAQAGGVSQSGSGNLLADTYGKLWIVSPAGAMQMLMDRASVGVFSPDGKRVAVLSGDRTLSLLSLDSRARRDIVTLLPGTHFGDIAWSPDGRFIGYEVMDKGTGDHLFLVSVETEHVTPRDLGKWYQGLSFSPDASRIVHAVNFPTQGLEVLDVATGKRTLVHEANKVVWDANFSPDGKHIAYRTTVKEPPAATDEEPNCEGPTLGLRLYTLADGSDRALGIRAPKGWEDVKNYAWSPDGSRIAVMVGTVGCDYPGDAVGVFLTSLDSKSQIRISTSSMALDPIFSPDGSELAFADAREMPASLMRYNLATGALALIVKGTESDGSFHLHGWK